MGEIADALRRARGIATPDSWARRSEAPLPASAPARPAPADAAAPGIPAIGARTVEALHPADPAIAVGEGSAIEATRKIAVRARALLEARGARSVAIVSAGRDEGKTTVACNLALALASMSQGRQVALVDLDLRKPSVARALALEAPATLDRVLRGELDAADVQLSIREPALDVYPAGEPQRRSHELLVLSHFAELVRRLEQRYAAVVIDTPPVLLVPDASLILEHVAACIPIARAGRTRERSFREMLDTLPRGVALEGLLNGGPAPGYYATYYHEDEDDDATGDGESRSSRRAKRKRRRRHGG